MHFESFKSTLTLKSVFNVFRWKQSLGAPGGRVVTCFYMCLGFYETSYSMGYLVYKHFGFSSCIVINLSLIYRLEFK